MVAEGPAQLLRNLDHCVLPTTDLSVARERLEALGFTVAPDAAHPFGTGNCCVFFGDGSYLEPLARIDPDIARSAEREDNVFVERDGVFRRQHGDEGFSAIVLATQDAQRDHARFVDARISAGRPLSFSRPFRDSSGSEAIASFQLAFAAPEKDDGHFFFTCQRINMPAATGGRLHEHANGVTGTGRIIMLSRAPHNHAEFLKSFSGERLQSTPSGDIELPLGNAHLCVMTPELYGNRFGIDDIAFDGDLDLAAIVFQCLDIVGLRDHLRAHQVLFAEKPGSIIVPPAAGQGAVFIFEECNP